MGELLGPSKPKAAPIVPLPDKEQIELNRKRDPKNRRRGGRQSTILSDRL